MEDAFVKGEKYFRQINWRKIFRINKSIKKNGKKVLMDQNIIW
jgi:hypothetical protein